MELLPNDAWKPPHLGDAYGEFYRREMGRNLTSADPTKAWGNSGILSKRDLRRKSRHRDLVLQILQRQQATRDLVLCDISAGAGFYTLQFAAHFKVIIHCDLSVDNLVHARERARLLDIRNIIFVRADYFRLPMRTLMDKVLCLDSLIRGSDHELAVVKSALGILGPGGEAVLDFHNWWHNPLRRLGLLPDNFRNNTSYTRRGAVELLRSGGAARNLDYYPFIQEVSAREPWRHVVASVLPATRLVFAVRADGRDHDLPHRSE